MSEIVVGTLRYRGEPAAATLTGSLIEDALRTALVDDGRLILVRRMALGRLGSTPGNRALAERTEAAWRELVARACHGSSSSAASADCVWFHSSAEARAHLLRELAAGRPAFGWFWRLAVPDWHGQPLTGWLHQCFVAALARSDGTALLETIEASLAADCVPAACAALASALPQDRGDGRVSADGMARRRIAFSDHANGGPSAAPQTRSAAIRQIAQTLAQRLPPTIRQVLRAAAVQRGGQRLVRDLARAMLRRSHPEVLLDSALFEQAADAFSLVLLDLPPPAPQPADPLPPDRIVEEVARAPAERDAPLALPDMDDTCNAPESIAARASSPPALHHAEARLPPPAPPGHALVPAELASAHAGLFLAVPVLIRLGWREWLMQWPELLPLRPGTGLLRHIAARHRVPRVDPLWSWLGEPAAADSDLLADMLEAWRRGVDGWLRRTVHRRLHDLIARPGWLSGDAERRVVRYRMAAIDMALRRRALDSDPGWTDWLGCSLRFEFRDRRLAGPLEGFTPR